VSARYAADYYDVLHASRGKDYAAEAATVDVAIRAHGRSGGRQLLDAACGTGLHLQHLRDSYTVEGLDVDDRMLARARERLGADVPLHRADMRSFDLGRSFDAVTCLFSAIGHTRSVAGLRRATARMAAHLKPGGVLVVEPWVHPENWKGERGLFVDLADRPDVKVARIGLTVRRGRLTTLEMHYLAGTLDGVEHVVERLQLGLFTHDEYVAALERVGLSVHHDPHGLIGRGLYVAVAPGGSPP
jgi:SAM-dependent methyltransferase